MNAILSKLDDVILNLNGFTLELTSDNSLGIDGISVEITGSGTLDVTDITILGSDDPNAENYSTLKIGEYVKVNVNTAVIIGDAEEWMDGENLTLIRCRINSHQPLCYCKNLKLVDCTFGEESDLAFENSEVNGNVIGPVPSITNMASGKVHVGKGTKIIDEPDVYEHHGLIVVEG